MHVLRHSSGSEASNGFYHIHNKIQSPFNDSQNSARSSHWSLSNSLFFHTTYTTCHYSAYFSVHGPPPPLQCKLPDSTICLSGLLLCPNSSLSAWRHRHPKLFVKSMRRMIFIMHVAVMLEPTLYQTKRKNSLSAALSEFVICLSTNG